MAKQTKKIEPATSRIGGSAEPADQAERDFIAHELDTNILVEATPVPARPAAWSRG